MTKSRLPSAVSPKYGITIEARNGIIMGCFLNQGCPAQFYQKWKKNIVKSFWNEAQDLWVFWFRRSHSLIRKFYSPKTFEGCHMLKFQTEIPGWRLRVGPKLLNLIVICQNFWFYLWFYRWFGCLIVKMPFFFTKSGSIYIGILILVALQGFPTELPAMRLWKLPISLLDGFQNTSHHFIWIEFEESCSSLCSSYELASYLPALFGLFRGMEGFCGFLNQ